MISAQDRITKILFIENDETSFQVRKCMARALSSLPPIELFHVHDATEALAILDELKPDVIVLDDETSDEKELLVDTLRRDRPPIVLRTEEKLSKEQKALGDNITRIPKNESLDGLHQTLVLVTAIGVKANVEREQLLH